MTLEMRDKENFRLGEIYGIIEVCRKCNLSEKEIMKILQKEKKVSERDAELYLEEAEEAIKKIHRYSNFIDALCKIILDSKKINADDNVIITKIQEKFNFNKDDAEFYYDYMMKNHINKINDSYVEKSEEAVEKVEENRKRQNEPMSLLVRKQDNYKIGEEKSREEGIFGAISICRDLGLSDSDILKRIQEKYNLSEQKASEYIQEA